ncbi:hypothetical protein CQW23_21449 [Capsicum baccatum]|uniref:Uncharacterized protein n=1 Tax=Capsicum baccatum TaxID=33114 RepID=A0A2G2VY22_CAPBA|nr:hypothetical protein CQW23_21449 [Capsicum baccatum]
MDHNDENSQLRVTLNDVLGLKDSDSLLHNDNQNDKEFFVGYDDGPYQDLDSRDEDIQNLVDEEINRSHESDEEEYLSVFDEEEYDPQDDGVEEDEGTMHDDAYIDAKYFAGLVVEHNHELDPALSPFLPCYRELSRTLKRILVAYNIAGLRPSKSIRILKVKSGGSKRMRCTPKDCRNYILQQWRLRTLSSDVAALYKFLLEMHGKDEIFFYTIDSDNIGRLLNTDDDMVVPNDPNSDSDNDAIFIRNLRDVCSREMPHINRNRSLCQNAFCRDGYRWGSDYYDVYNEGQSSQNRSCGMRKSGKGSRGGGVCGSRGGRGDATNISNHPTVHQIL